MSDHASWSVDEDEDENDEPNIQIIKCPPPGGAELSIRNLMYQLYFGVLQSIEQGHR